MEKIPLWVHSTKCRNGQTNSYVIKEKLYSKDENGNDVWEDNLKIIDDPMRTFWVTKPQFRNHEYKKEFEEIDKLDEYKVRDSEMIEKIKSVLGIYSKKVGFKELCNSPYLYGCDIKTDVLIRNRYKGLSKDLSPELSVGSLDIENEITDQKRINLCSFMNDKTNTVYTAYLKEYLKEYDGIQRKDTTEERLKEVIQREIGDILKEFNITVVIRGFDTEIDIVRWIFNEIRKSKLDFVGIWNIDHDMPKMMEVITKYGYNLEDVMCPKELPKKYRYISYYKDKKQVDHIIEKWNWCYATGYTQYVDSMALYGRIRKAKSKESSYSLDAIAKKILGIGKLLHKRVVNHHWEQHYNFLVYTAYNILDSLLIPLMNRKTKDFNSLIGLTDISMLNDFNKQTALVKDNMYPYLKSKGKILASTGNKMQTPFDELIPKVGGSVLPPHRTIGMGINPLIEANTDSQVILVAGDIDAESQYPNALAAFNIAKETKLATALAISGHYPEDIEIYFSNISSPLENCVYLANRFYNLPNYQTIDKEFDMFIKEKSNKEDECKEEKELLYEV